MDDVHPHWAIYVSCAVLTTTSVLLLIISDVGGARDFGRWGILCAIGAALMGCVIICHRYAYKLHQSSRTAAEELVDGLEDLVAKSTGAVITAYEARTEEIAEAVCESVVRVINTRDNGATPIAPRRGG